MSVQIALTTPEDEFRIIYCATDRAAAFGETLSRLRRSPALLALMQDVDDDDEQIEDALEGLIDPSDMARGVVPADWRFKRRIGTTRLDPSLQFADIMGWDSIEHLRIALAPKIAELRLSDFDASTILSTNRQITRHCARYIYEQHDDDGSPRCAGIRYPSRLNIEWSCWAIFDDRMKHNPDFNEFHDTTINANDPDLLRILQQMSLSLEAVRGHRHYITGR